MREQCYTLVDSYHQHGRMVVLVCFADNNFAGSLSQEITNNTNNVIFWTGFVIICYDGCPVGLYSKLQIKNVIFTAKANTLYYPKHYRKSFYSHYWLRNWLTSSHIFELGGLSIVHFNKKGRLIVLWEQI